MAESSQIRDVRLAKSLAGIASRQLELANEAMAFAAHLLGHVDRSEQLGPQQHHQWGGRDDEIDDGPDLKDGDDDHEDDEGDGDGLSDGEECPALAQIVAHCEEVPDSIPTRLVIGSNA